MSDQDPHSPTSAGPEPTPVVGASDATWSRPAGSAMPGGGPAGGAGAEPERPEILVGAAFAGGIVAAMVLKRIFRRD